VAETPEPEPEPEPEPVVAETPQAEPAVVGAAEPPGAVDAVEEAKAAMWRRRMKNSPVPGTKGERNARPESRAGEEVTDKEPDEAEGSSGETPADGEKKSPGDVDVVALAREFSGLFGDEGREG
jgi:hypothetical protein